MESLLWFTFLYRRDWSFFVWFKNCHCDFEKCKKCRKTEMMTLNKLAHFSASKKRACLNCSEHRSKKHCYCCKKALQDVFCKISLVAYAHLDENICRSMMGIKVVPSCILIIDGHDWQAGSVMVDVDFLYYVAPDAVIVFICGQLNRCIIVSLWAVGECFWQTPQYLGNNQLFKSE